MASQSTDSPELGKVRRLEWAATLGALATRWRPRALVYGLACLGILGLLARLLLIYSSLGSNDMVTWKRFARLITKSSVGQLYDTERLYNHPPLMGLFGSAALSLSRWSGIRFDWLFKAPMVLADVVVAVLLYQLWKRRGPHLAAAVFALFCWNPVSILISAYHGNTDSLCASLMLAAALLMDRKLAFCAGLALALSINVKLIPVLLIPPLLACARSWKEAARFTLGLSLGVVPFLPFLIGHWPGFYKNVLSYRSNAGRWGLTLILGKLAANEHLAAVCGALGKFWLQRGPLAVLLWPVLMGGVQRWTRQRWSACELAACTMVGFLVLTPGWGVQYLVYPVPLLFAASLTGALWFSLWGGLYAFVLYASLWSGERPFFSDFAHGHPLGAWLMGCLAWVIAGRALFDVLRADRRPRVSEIELGQ